MLFGGAAAGLGPGELAESRAMKAKDRRRYAAVEALKQGGVQYIAELFDCHPHTIRHGAADIERLPVDEAAGRVRKKGGPQAS